MLKTSVSMSIEKKIQFIHIFKDGHGIINSEYMQLPMATKYSRYYAGKKWMYCLIMLKNFILENKSN